jgi:hypothetical protein
MALLFAVVHMSAFGTRRTTHYLLAGDATYAEKFLKATSSTESPTARPFRFSLSSGSAIRRSGTGDATAGSWSGRPFETCSERNPELNPAKALGLTIPAALLPPAPWLS